MAGIPPHLILFAFSAFPGNPFSTWGLEIVGRSPFIRQIVNHGTGFALINGRIVMRTQAEGTKMEKKGGDRSDEKRDSTSRGKFSSEPGGVEEIDDEKNRCDHFDDYYRNSPHLKCLGR